MDCYPKRLESYRANDISCLLIFSREELTSPGSVQTHTPSPGVGKVGDNLINRGCVVTRERFESHLSQHQDPGGPQGVQAGGGITLHTLHHDHVVISHGATREVWVPARFPQAKRLTGGSPWECFVSNFSFFFPLVAQLARTQVAKPSPHQLLAPTSLAGQGSCSAPQGALTPRLSSSSPSPSLSAVPGLQRAGSSMGTEPTPTYRLKETRAV